MKLAILSLPKIERDKLMQTLLADKTKGDVGFIRASGLDPEVFDRQFLTVCISRDLCSTSVSLHKNELEMLWSMNQLDALIESGSREPFHVRKAGTFDGDMDAAREAAAKVMDEARREAGYRGETREDLKKWLIETGRLPANCDDLMEPLIEKPKTRGRKENTGAILMPDADELRSVLNEVSEALKDKDAIGIVTSSGPFIYFIAKTDSGLPAKLAVAGAEGISVLGALFIKRGSDGVSGRHQMFQKYEHDETASHRVQEVLDKMLSTPAGGTKSELLNISEVPATLKGSRDTNTAQENTRVEEGISNLGDLSGCDAKKLNAELSDQSAHLRNDKNAQEAALDQPYHLFFCSAVDLDGETRFFDLMTQNDGISIAETAFGAAKLGQCVETTYGIPGGGTHHVHRLYGKVRASTALQAMHRFAKLTGLRQVMEIAETRTQREAGPTWNLIFEKLGCLAVVRQQFPRTDSQCLIDLLPERLPSSFEAIESARLDVFFALGIVNPVGPTFSFVAAVGEPEEGKVLPVVYVMLNPFSQSVEEVARFTVGARWKPVNDLEPLIQLGFGSCPSLVLLNAEIPEESRLSFAAKVLGTFGQGAVVVHELVRSYFGDPWTRVSVEMKDAGTRVSAEMQGARRRPTSSLTQAEASKQLAQSVLQPEHMWPELRALLFAWSGSIHKTGILKQMAAEAFPKERFEKFLLERVCPTLWLPPEPNQEPPAGHLEPPSHRESPGGQKLASTSREERITGDVGPQLLTFIYEEMKIDREWSVREERNLTWWGHRLAQRIWAETVMIEDGDEIVRVHAETDVLRDVNAEAHPARTLSILNRNASLSAYVWNPQTKKISLRASAYFHSQNFPWLSVFFLSSVSLQAAEAHLQPDALAKLIGGEVDESAHPKNGFREKRDEMLDVIKLFYAPEGNNPSRFTEEDFHAAMNLNPSPWLMVNEDEEGLAAEFPFPGCMPPTALLKVDSETKHPQLGSGLFILLRLPLTLRGADVDSLAARLNIAELRNTTRSHFMGSWCVDSERNLNLAQRTLLLTGDSLPVGVLDKGAKEILSFCSFIPSVCHRPGLLENIIYTLGCRTMWANEYLASNEGVPAEFGPRHSGAFQEQSVQHLSLIKRVLDHALRQIKKKPN
jgi:hypothetical protein